MEKENKDENNIENSSNNLDENVSFETSFFDVNDNVQNDISDNEIIQEENPENQNTNDNSKEEETKNDTYIETNNLIDFQQEIVSEEKVKENYVTITDDNEEEIQDINETEELITVRPVKFQEFNNQEIIHAFKKNLDIMQNIPLRVSVEIGRTNSSIREVMELKKGSVVELDKVAGEQVEIYVNNIIVARGEVIYLLVQLLLLVQQ